MALSVKFKVMAYRVAAGALVIGLILGLYQMGWLYRTLDAFIASLFAVMYWVMFFHMNRPEISSNPYRPVLRNPKVWLTGLTLGNIVLFTFVILTGLWITLVAIICTTSLDVYMGTKAWRYFRRTGEAP